MTMDLDRDNVSDVEELAEFSSEEETDEEISLQQPYQFEPCTQQNDCESQSYSTPESTDESCRVGNIDCAYYQFGFEPVCLNPFVLETAYLHFKQEYDDSLDTHTQAEKYRYTACSQLVRCCYGFLGRNIPLPSCAVNRIRTEFPEDGQGYTGFRLPLL